jgi:hypothetical protein
VVRRVYALGVAATVAGSALAVYFSRVGSSASVVVSLVIMSAATAVATLLAYLRRPRDDGAPGTGVHRDGGGAAENLGLRLAIRLSPLLLLLVLLLLAAVREW